MVEKRLRSGRLNAESEDGGKANCAQNPQRIFLKPAVWLTDTANDACRKIVLAAEKVFQPF